MCHTDLVIFWDQSLGHMELIFHPRHSSIKSIQDIRQKYCSMIYTSHWPRCIFRSIIRAHGTYIPGMTCWVLGATRCLMMSTFLPSHFKGHWGMAKLWTRHGKKDPIFYLLISKCDLDLGASDLCVTHRVLMINISVKSFQNLSRNGKVMDWHEKKYPICDF